VPQDQFIKWPQSAVIIPLSLVLVRAVSSQYFALVCNLERVMAVSAISLVPIFVTLLTTPAVALRKPVPLPVSAKMPPRTISFGVPFKLPPTSAQ